MSADLLARALESVVRQDGLLLFGPGAPDPLPPGVHRRHVPAGALVGLAEGASLADPGRPVVAVGRERDFAGPELGPLLQAARRNSSITCMALGDRTPLLEMARAAGAPLVAAVAPGAGLDAVLAQYLAQPGFALMCVGEGLTDACYIGEQRAAFEGLARNQAPLLTAVWSASPDVWDRLLWNDLDDEEEEDGEWAGQSQPWG